MRVKIDTDDKFLRVASLDYGRVFTLSYKDELMNMGGSVEEGCYCTWSSELETVKKLYSDIRQRGWLEVNEYGRFFFTENDPRMLRQKKLERVLG